MHQQPASIPSPAAGRISNRQVLCAASSSAEAHFFHELEKFQARHQAGEFLPFCRAYHIGVHVGFHRRLTADGAELPAQIGAVLPGGQLAAYPVPDLRRVDMRVQLVQGMERVQQSEGGLFPHPRHPRDVVARVPHQGLEIDELGGRQPVFFPDGGDIVGGGVGAAHFGRGQQHRHAMKQSPPCCTAAAERVPKMSSAS